ncbi:MAG: type II secretion system ATPase GspE [Candidatus Manganitrophus sp.]|nr:type II secretion system ATPase GspE [Candidatus Manganitrophus sp.]WDT70617.1 MAG: type II secretion system ATPase GspE [Candidatus Manganitrophus sp.]
MPQPQQKRKMLGEMLIAEGLLSNEQLKRALAEQKTHGGRIGVVLKSLGLVTEDDIIKVLGKQMGIQYVDLSGIIVEPEIIQIVPEMVARRHQIIPLYKKGSILTLAMADPLNVFAIDDVKRTAGCEIEPVMSKESDVMKAIDRYYSGAGSLEEAAREADRQGFGVAEEGDAVIELSKLAEDTPVVKFVNTMITQAIKEGSSDIHIEPDGEVLRIRFRRDGLLREVMTAPRNLQSGVASRIKIMADLDIAEKRVPQDGRIQMKVGDRDIDIRLSTLPTLFGEKIVMRLLDKSKLLLSLSDLGFSTEGLQIFEKMIRRPYGLVLVTGPTGSGKTTTIYSALKQLSSVERNIVTIEDPVEYQIKLINQVPVNTKVGVTFANGLRSILRQDPDIVMVGEIRDRETATIAIQAALTGHLVLSTLHTNDAAGAIARLVDMGVEPFLIASSLIGIAAQRLVRKVCNACKKSYAATPQLLNDLGLSHLVNGKREITFARGEGCPDCRGSGYSGRIAIYELLMADDPIRQLVVTRAASSEIRKYAANMKFKSLRVEGLFKAVQGMTTVEEVFRVTQEFDGDLT